MQGEFKQCPNGHYFQGGSCPYCKTNNPQGNVTSLKTEVFVGCDNNQSTEIDSSMGSRPFGGTQTTVIENPGSTTCGNRRAAPNHGRTVFGDEYDELQITNAQGATKNEARYGRKLVGWLVSYSSDELGVDYKLYEGRNIIGRDVDCNVTVNDGRMSGKHAVLLFRANKYSLTDSQSSHGTFVNEEDIELEPRYLKDGDIIRMGSTVFKFRSSL